MHFGAFIWLAVVGCLTVIMLLAILLVRLFNKSTNLKAIRNDGLLLTEVGIEFLIFPLMERSKKSYAEIEAVELVRFPASLTLRMRYAPSVASHLGPRWNFLQDVVVVKLKRPCSIQYHLFTPKDAERVVERIRSRLG